MKALFKKCLDAQYKSTPFSGNYAVTVERDTLYLLFEWSRGREDWKNNLNFPAKPYKNMGSLWFCHRGFLKVWRAMRDELEKDVRCKLATHPKIKYIVCVGYSHGGALALLATEDMEYLYGDTLDVLGFGFGAPRVVWGFLPKEVKYRLEGFSVIRNVPDLVTHLPPAVFGFRHVGEVIKVGKAGKYSPVKAHYPEAYLAELTEDSV